MSKVKTAHVDRDCSVPVSPREKNIFNMLSDRPCDIDTIVRKLELKSQQAKFTLLNMEMKGVIKQLPGKLYIRA